MAIPETVRKNLITYEEMQELVKPIDRLEQVDLMMKDNKTDFLEESGRFYAEVEDEFGKERYELSTNSIVGACGLVGISQGYVNKFPREDIELLIPHLNYWFNKRRRRFSLLVDPDTNIVEAFNPDIHHDYKMGDIVQIAYDTMKERAGEVLFDKTHCTMDKGLHFGIVLPQVQEEPDAGDYFAAGIHVRDSRIGKFKLRMSTYLLRLVCTNGMISTHPTGQAERKTTDDYKMDLHEWAHQALTISYENIEEEFNRVRGLVNRPVTEHSDRFTNKLFREYPVPRTTTNALLDGVERSETLYDVFNVITSHANNPDYEGDPLRIEQIQMMAGRVASHSEFCEYCHSEL